MAPMRQQQAIEEWKAGAATRRGTGLDHAAFSRPAETASERRRDLLTKAIISEVIPRLVVAHQPRKLVGRKTAVRAVQPTPLQVADLVELVMTSDQPASMGFVEAMRDTGMSFDSIYLDLLTPTARRLGVMWEEDLCSFADVTIGLVRLHHVMQTLSVAFTGDVVPLQAAPTALLTQMPGEQHGFGLSMVIQFFRRAGWSVHSEQVANADALCAVVRAQSFGIVGISVACDPCMDQLATTIQAVRRQSMNKSVGIMVGGPVFNEQPQLAAMVGADATATDGRQAVRQAKSLMTLLAAHQ